MSDSVYPDTPLDTSNHDKEFIEVVRKLWKEADRFRDPIQKKWNYHFRLLNGVASGDYAAKTWRTNRFVNLTSVASTILKSRFYQGMPVGQAEGRTLEASLNEEKINSMLSYDQDRGKMEIAMGSLIDDGVDYACGLMRTGWKTETMENISVSDGFLKKMIKAIRKLIPGFKESQILYDGPTFDWVDPWSFRWDPNGIDIDDCSWCGEETDETVYQMRKDPAIDADILDNVSRFEQEMSIMKQRDAQERLAAFGLTKADANRLYGKVKDGLHTVKRYWGAYDIDGDGIEEEVRGIIIDDMFVGCLEENPYWHRKKPYAKWAFNNIPGFFVGRSLVDQAAQSQEELNDLQNNSGDVRKLTARPIIKIRLGADIEPETITFAPGALMPVESMDDIDFYQPDTSALDALLKQMGYEREMFQLLTGMNDVTLGQQDVGIGDNTATGAAIAQEQTELRYKAAAIGLDLVVERIGEMLIWNEQQFRNRKEVVPVRDELGNVKYKTIAPKDLSGLFSYRMISSSLSLQTPSMKVNNLLKALNVIQNNPQYNASPIIDQLIKELGIDPNTLKSVQGGPGDAPPELSDVAKFAALPPDAQQKALASMSPEDQELMQQALSQLNASPQGSQPQPQPVQGVPIQGGAPQGPPLAPPPTAGVGTATQ